MSKRVYKFRSAEFGLLNLKERRLKLSTIDDLNDPFDLCSLDITDPAIEHALNAYIEHFRRTTGLLCFSRNWDNLLLWSHYANSHTGLCLGFDIPDGSPADAYDVNVHYQPNLLQIRRPEDVNYDLANPPYNVGQKNENDRNPNRKYKEVDARVRETYAKDSDATNKNSLADTRAFLSRSRTILSC